jgi:hypothetical protein
MNIKITKSTESAFPELMWYATEIGKTFEVYKEEEGYFIVWTGVEDFNTGEEMTGMVYKLDCAIED